MIKKFQEFLENVGNDFTQEPSWGGGLYPRPGSIDSNIGASYEDAPHQTLKDFEVELEGIGDVVMKSDGSSYYFLVKLFDMNDLNSVPKKFKQFSVVISD